MLVSACNQNQQVRNDINSLREKMSISQYNLLVNEIDRTGNPVWAVMIYHELKETRVEFDRLYDNINSNNFQYQYDSLKEKATQLELVINIDEVITPEELLLVESDIYYQLLRKFYKHIYEFDTITVGQQKTDSGYIFSIHAGIEALLPVIIINGKDSPWDSPLATFVSFEELNQEVNEIEVFAPGKSGGGEEFKILIE